LLKFALRATEMASEASFDAIETYYIRKSKIVSTGKYEPYTNAIS